jgi:hypothetical protein
MIELHARISLKFKSPTIAKQLVSIISPDNAPLPEGMAIKVNTNGAILNIEIESTRGIDSFRGTIEDIMSAIDLSLRTMDSVPQNR